MVNSDFYQSGRTLAIACHLLGKLNRHRLQSPAEFVEINFSRQPVSHDSDGITGAGIGIDTDHIKRTLNGFFEALLQGVRRDLRISHKIAEHSSHVWLDHAYTFGDPDQDGIANLAGTHLRARISGHDSKSGLIELAGLHIFAKATNTLTNLLHREKPPDNTCC